MTNSEASCEAIPHRTAANAIIHFGFAVGGVVTVLLGPILPILIARWSLSDQRAGLFFTLQFVGNLLGVALLGPVLSWRGYGTSLTAGYVCIALGVAGLNLGSEFVALLATALFGCGLGLAMSGSNLWAAEISPSRRAAAVSVLNVAWGVGAIACPPLVLFAQRSHRLSQFLLCVGGLAAVAACVVATMDVEPRSHPMDAEDDLQPKLGRRAALAMGALFFLYAGTETAVGGWGAAFAKRVGAKPTGPWELAPMFFWTGIMVGRILVSLILPRISERAFLIGGLFTAAASSGALLSAATFRAAAVYLMVAGLGLACVYPLLVAWMVGHFGKQARFTGNILFGLACLGGASMPWLVGFISTHAASLRAGLLAPLTACFVMLGLQFLLRKPGRAQVSE